MRQSRACAIVTVVSGVIACGMLVERSLLRAEAQEKQEKVIRASEIQLVDDDGKVRVALKAEKSTTSGRMIYDSEGKLLAGLTVDKAGKPALRLMDGKSSVVRAQRVELVDEYDRPRGTWSCTSGGAEFKMSDDLSKTTFSLRATECEWENRDGRTNLKPGQIVVARPSETLSHVSIHAAGSSRFELTKREEGQVKQ
jgi:hypothetical protein